MQKVLESLRIISGGQVTDECYDIVITDGIVSDITLSRTQTIGRYATAGYIDIHTHGGFGHDYFEATQEAADAVGRFHLSHGTTSFCATSVATPCEELDRLFGIMRGLQNKYAKVLGVHLEGPFISLAQKGAQPEKNIKTVFEGTDARFFNDNRDIIRIVTLCPNTENAPELVRTLVANGIVAHAGHDDSVYPQIMACVEAGLTGTTHLYCASSGVRRRPGNITKYLGLNETTLSCDRMFAEVLADDIHVPEALFKFILRNKGYKNIALVSDSLSAAGMPVGNYTLGADIPIYNNGSVALLLGKQTLAGSISPVANAVRHLIRYGVPMAQAVYMANEAPAGHIGREDIGCLRVGAAADINIIDDSGNVLSTYIDGVDAATL